RPSRRWRSRSPLKSLPVRAPGPPVAGGATRPGWSGWLRVGGAPARAPDPASDLADLDDFPPLVISAVRADPVWQFVLLAVRALRKGRAGQGVVGAPLVPACARVTSFRIRHRCVLVALEEIFQDPESTRLRRL